MIRSNTDVIRAAGVSERIRVAREAVSGELGERPPDTVVIRYDTESKI